MKYYVIAGLRKTENLSRAAATRKELSHYDVISKIAQHLQGTNLRFNNIFVLHKYKMQKTYTATRLMLDLRCSVRLQ